MSAPRHHAAVDDAHLGRRYRALRQRLGWRQEDLATRSGVSRGLVSLIERGRIEEVMIRQLRRVARELDAELTSLLRWRGGELDRLMDEGHAALVGRVAMMLRELGWDVRLEVSYSVYGERGSIDVLAWHPVARVLLVVEVKTELVAIEETLRKHDQKARLATQIAAEQFGWEARAVGRFLVLPSLSTPRRRVERHAAVMDVAYPLRGLSLRRWLESPGGATAGLLFVDVTGGVAQRRSVTARKRIRRRAA
jgi:transcriptional regulator with XRE-family HTH domain